MGDDIRDYWKPQATLIIGAFIVFCLAVAELWRSAGAWTRRSVIAILVLIAIGLGLLYSAATISQWCASPDTTHGSIIWGGHAWHNPSLADCLRSGR